MHRRARVWLVVCWFGGVHRMVGESAHVMTFATVLLAQARAKARVREVTGLRWCLRARVARPRNT
jgi:hypothetical protein